MTKLVFVHGRAQEHKDSVALKAEWIDAFRDGLSAAGQDLAIDDSDVRFPYYGDTLHQLTEGVDADAAARIIVRGENAAELERDFVDGLLGELVEEALRRAKASGALTDQQIQAALGSPVIQRGPLDWGWVQRGLELLETHVPGASSGVVAVFTSDVFNYLHNPAVKHIIESGVSEAMTPGQRTVVVAHSLGSIVAYNLLRREGGVQGWDVPLFVTVGSPLAVKAVRNSLAPLNAPPVVERWFNALDPADIVALYPLEAPRFSVDGIENFEGVENPTPNRHGISGYLGDPVVARRIAAALRG